jgi:hypothetical protein
MSVGISRGGHFKFPPAVRVFSVFAVALACVLPASASGAHSVRTSWLIAVVDGDDKPDLVTITTPSAGSAEAIGIPSVQSGNFAAPVFALAGRFPAQRLRARDLDGDSDRDIVLETMSSVALAVWINDGSGHFSRGNLEDFKSQLEPETPTSFSAEVRPLLLYLTDENRVGDSVPRLSGSRFLPYTARLPRFRAEHFPASALTALTTRGPPRNS